MTNEKKALELALESLLHAYHEDEAHPKTLETITAIKELLAQPEQEPVATLDDLEQEIYENTRQFVSRDVMEWMLKRYYTIPPQRPWVDLTDDEMLMIYGQDHEDKKYNLGRMVQKALKEKNS